MFAQTIQLNLKKSHIYFAIGLCLVIASGWLHLFPSVRTFMFTWRVELASSIFIIVVCSYLLTKNIEFFTEYKPSKVEKHLIILPLVAFVIWSGFSAFWAVSWKSALFHSAIWCEYLVFYLVTRRLLDFSGNYKLLIFILTVLLVIIAFPVIIEYGFYLYLNAGTTLGVRFSKYAEIVNLICPLLIAGSLRMSGRQFYINLSIIVVMWLFIISTLSRTGSGLFLAGILLMTGIIFAFSQFKKYRYKMIFLILVLFVAPIPLHLITFLSNNPSVTLVSRINDPAVSATSDNSRKLLTDAALEIVKTNYLIGIGADNFGIKLNKYRAIYGEKNPADINTAAFEDEIAERTHNEYLQIICELGAIGGLIFLFFLSSIAVMLVYLIKNRKHTSLYSFAAVCGVILFLASSAVSSYSFRLVQNGFVFFFVLAVCSKTLFPKNLSNQTNNKTAFICYFYKAILSISILICGFLGINSVFRAVSAYYSTQLLNLTDANQGLFLYENAVWYDNENPLSYLGYGQFLLNEKRYHEAIQPLTKSIELGEETSADYSLLATSQYLSGDIEGAAQTFGEAVKVYPRSTFVRTRYADLLLQLGKKQQSQDQKEISSSIDLKSTNTWWSLMHIGVAKTNNLTLKDKDYLIVFDLRPINSYKAYMMERWILYPEEKPKFEFLSD